MSFPRPGSYTCELILILLLAPVFLAAQKNDTVYFLNGDKLTGELKRYANSVLVFKTDGMGTINIEYDRILTLHSSKFYEIVRKSGFSYYGSIISSRDPRHIGIVVTNDTVKESIDDIVEIIQINKRFWKKFDGSFELGLSYYKATNTLQYYFNGDLSYRARKDLIELEVGLSFSKQDISDSLILTKKNDIGLSYGHFFQGRWWGGIGTKWQQNTELDLEYRVQVGLGAGYDIVRTNPVRFYVLGGLLVNREKPIDSVSPSTNLEGLLSAKCTWLQFRHPKIDISTNINAYPSITIRNRFRLEYNLSFKYEIVKDFFIGLTFYDDYDSKPSGGGPALNDWSVVFSIGYSF